MSNQTDSAKYGIRLERRTFLHSVAAGALPLVAGVNVAQLSGNAAAAPAAVAETGSAASLIIREKDPPNLEYLFTSLDGRITPNDKFFVRCHFPLPKVDRGAWRLQVDGEVDHPLKLSYDELRALPAKTVAATLECAGNSRVMLVPKAAGVQWQTGAVSNATWTGVPLAAVLEKAGVRSGAVDVVCEGADSGAINDEPKSPGVVSFARSLPLAQAQSPEVLLAYQMNGEDLPPEHGAPLRVVVPGWYGMASVKWLQRLTVTDKPFDGYWQTFQYSHWDRSGGQPVMTPITEMQVKSEIARPATHERVAAGRPYRVFGAAWAGEPEITKVEVSTDAGGAWQPARLLETHVPFVWRLWEFDWQVPPGKNSYTLMSRATDSRGRTQPAKHDPDRRAYMINFTLPVEVEAV